MTAHWKHGNGFSIRYGGRGQIAWFFNEGVSAVTSQVSGALHPARLVLDAVDTAATVGLWWETRKQTAVMTAEFEERRLLWCADLMAVLSDEVASGQAFRADTTHMLECELRRTMAVLTKTSRMELPYSFLLQCGRVARALSSLNRVTYSELTRQSAEGQGLLVPQYVPHDQLRALLPPTEARTGVVQSLANALPSIFGSSDDPLENWMRLTKKDPELAAMENLALELRSAEELLEAIRGLPETVREPGPDEQVADLAGVLLLAGKLGVPLLPSTG